MEENTNIIKYHIVDKKIKKEKNPFTKLIKTLLCYEFIGALLVGTVIGIVCMLITDIDKIIQANELIIKYDGIVALISYVIGFIFIYLYRKPYLKKDIIEVNHKMTIKAFIQIFFVFFMGQFVFTILSQFIEYLLSYFGLSMQQAINSATMQSNTLSMILYASFAAPIMEEVVLRGAVCKSLTKYGKTFAIVVSAVFFGIMHGNIIQGLFAFCIGLVLGYVTLEYSLKWAILLHFINNFVFGVVIERSVSLLNYNVSSWILFSMYLIFFIAGLIVLLKNRYKIKEYIEENKTEKGFYKKMFCNGWMIIYILLHILPAISMISYIA